MKNTLPVRKRLPDQGPRRRGTIRDRLAPVSLPSLVARRSSFPRLAERASLLCGASPRRPLAVGGLSVRRLGLRLGRQVLHQRMAPPRWASSPAVRHAHDPGPDQSSSRATSRGPAVGRDAEPARSSQTPRWPSDSGSASHPRRLSPLFCDAATRRGSCDSDSSETITVDFNLGFSPDCSPPPGSHSTPGTSDSSTARRQTARCSWRYHPISALTEMGGEVRPQEAPLRCQAAATRPIVDYGVG